MTTTLREILARRADDAGRPNLDLADLVGRGEARLRRRRFAEVAGGAAAVVLVVGVAVGVALNGPVNRGDGPPAHSPSPTVTRPSPSPTETPAPQARQLVYVDIVRDPTPHKEGTIHFGERAIASANAMVHMDVTDDGFVYISRGDVWFSDGSDPVQIGSRVCESPTGDGLQRAVTDLVLTGDSGSLVAWFACADPASPTLVVYDTGSGREVVRRPMPSCFTPVVTGPEFNALAGCDVLGVIGQHIYFSAPSGVPEVPNQYSYDVSTGTQKPASARSFSDDVRSQPRGLVYGDTWETAKTPQDQRLRRWTVVNARLVPIAGDVAKDGPTTAFDTKTHRAVHLSLPAGYWSDGTGFDIFEWLDDDTVALISGHNEDSADIITCRLSQGSCHLAVKALPPGTVRLAPTQSLPG